MRRNKSWFERVMPLLVALVAVAILGLHVTPKLRLVRVGAATICSLEQRPSQDTLKAGERVEPRVFPAPQTDRLPPLPPCRRTGIATAWDVAGVPSVTSSEPRADDWRIAIVKHVPRLERGDPPRT